MSSAQRLEQVRSLTALVREMAHEIILPRYLRAARERKADGSVLTEADLASQAALVERLPRLIKAPVSLRTSGPSSMTSRTAAPASTLGPSCNRAANRGSASWCATTTLDTRPASHRASPRLAALRTHGASSSSSRRAPRVPWLSRR